MVAPQVNLWVQVDRGQAARHYAIDANVLNYNIPRIGILTRAWTTGTQTQIVKGLKGFQRCTLQASLHQLFANLQAYSNGYEFDPFKDDKRTLRQATDDASKRRVLMKWCITLCDICDILDHDAYLGCSNFMFEQFLVAFETLFPQLRNLGMRNETSEVFYALTKIFRGTKQVYLDRLHAIWNGLGQERRDTLLRELCVNRHIRGPGKTLDRMYYAIQHPRRPRNMAEFDED